MPGGFNRAASIITLLYAAFCAATAAAQNVRYDPETCAGDVGDRVFVRLESGLAFAFPADHLALLGAPVETRRPIANPDEPEGCPLNPIVTSHFSVIYQPVTPPAEGEPPDRRWRPEVLQLFGHDGPVMVQSNVVDRFRRNCRPGDLDVLVELPAGLQECRLNQPDTPDSEDWPSRLVARPGAYFHHKGRPFAIACDGVWRSGGPRECDAYYVIRDGLSVTYRFSDERVPPKQMIAFDRQIRAFIEARRTPQYDVASGSG